jgi:beta-mannosidase
VVQDPLPYPTRDPSQSNQPVNDTFGPSRSFYFRVNGLPVWCKGANDVPSDQFESRVTPARLWNYLSSARDSHMTMLRVWGGGLFERDEFYEYCDRLGLLVYHDMMWSDQIYPWHKPFLETAAAETRYQVRRLSRHASLVLWSLTNELLPGAVTNLGNYGHFADYKNPEQWAPSGGSVVAGSFVYTMGAQQLFFGTVGRVIAETDASRALWPTSPSNGWLSEGMLLPDMCIHQARSNIDANVAKEFTSPVCYSSNPARGDGHFYTSDPAVAFNASTMLPPTRFCSENGAESWPSLGPISAVTDAADRWLGSEQMQFRERAGSWGPAQVDWVRYHFGDAPVAAANRSAASGLGGAAAEGREEGGAFATFLVLSQLSAGLGLGAIAQQFRLQKKSAAAGATMGHLLWQLQDNWPGQSFGLLNYGGEWKQQLHVVRRAFAPLLVTAAGGVGADGSTAVHLVSDLPEGLRECAVEASEWAFGSEAAAPLRRWNATVPQVAAGGVEQALALLQPPAASLGASFVRLSVSCSGGESSRGEHFFPGTNFSAVRRQLLPPNIRASEWATAGTDCTLTLSADAPALFVIPSAAQELEGRFSDSAFALVPGEPRQLSFKTASGGACDVGALERSFAAASLHSLLK